MCRSPFRRAATLFALATAVAACGDDGHENHSSGSSTSSAGSSQAGCANDPRAMAFASGMQVKSASGRLVAEIVTATPSPPQRGAGEAGMNTWTTKLTLDGTKPADGSITVKTYMPEHGHGSPRVPEVTPNADGTYAVTGLYLFMAGLWEISFLAANGSEAAMFSICVQ